MPVEFFARRQLRKASHETLRHARHVRNMREDVARPADLDALDRDTAALKAALSAGQAADIRAAMDTLAQRTTALMPPKRHASFQENLEVLVVAVAVAMAFRTYFIQPFKIPTGSMQPTLYGITAVERDGPGFLDRWPAKLLKWAVTGEYYREARVKLEGTLSEPREAGDSHPGDLLYQVSGRVYRVPRNARMRYRPNERVPAGALLWSGSRTAGDHVFVDKVRWNFRRPRRGEVMVFDTKGIASLPPGTHYIKRMVGLPGETVAVVPPKVLIDGKEVEEPAAIRRIEDRERGYDGYQVIGLAPGYLRRPGDEFKLDDRSYFAMGDNTGNSRDSRYWGAVPRENLVGPAVLVYWPFSRRWGSIR